MFTISDLRVQDRVVVIGALKKPLGTNSPTDLKRKLAAWWNGDEYTPRSGGLSLFPEGDGTARSRPLPPDIVLAMAVAQALWGEGYLGPGGEAHYIDLMRQLRLNNEKSLAVLGIGLAGPARDIVRDTDVWITGYEARPPAIDEATRQCTVTGLAKKVIVNAYDPDTVEFPEKKYDSIISFEELCFISEKSRLFEQIEAALKPSGSVLITAYVTTSGALPAETLETCFPPVWGTADLWTVEQYVQAISGTGLGLHVQEDLTPNYLGFLQDSSEGWRRLLKHAQALETPTVEDAAVLRAVATAAGTWSARLQALQEGSLAVYRFMALKASDPRA